MKLFDGHHIALVTGASRGIGRATALTFGHEGIAVAVNYFRCEEAALEVVRNIEKVGGRAIAVKGDVSQVDDVRRMIETTVKQLGAIDILVNNAGALPRPADWRNITEQAWQESFDVNLRSAFNCIRNIAPIMLENKRGRIVNVSSTYGIFGSAAVVAYVAAKAGVISLTKGFAKELAPHITVNAVAPGHIKTDLTPKREGFVETISAATPLRRLGEAQEVADVIVFLASDRAAFITGEIVAIDGGHMLK